MNKCWEEAVKQTIKMNVAAADFSEQTENRILEHVHHQVKKRRTIMKLTKKQTGLVIAAVLVVFGAVTALGAGKIAYLMSGHSINDEVNNISELTEQVETALGEMVKIPEQFSDGTEFSSGIVVEVSARDEEGNQVDSFPEANIYYTHGICLSISKPIQEVSKKETALQSENYQDIQIKGNVDQYLFLPPDAQPSEEEKKLEEEGKLMISYGSSEAERKSFTTASWDEGSLHYLIFTFDEIALEDVMKLAREVIDSER